MHGIEWIFANCPIWAIALLFVLVVYAPMYAGRDLFEGAPYQVSYSAMIGDAGLVIIALIAAEILHQPGVALSQDDGVEWQLFALIFFMACGSVVSWKTLKSRWGRLMDIYHDVIIAPMFLTLAVTLLPVIYINGNEVEKWVTALLVLLWVVLVVFDLKFKRMNQRKWLTERGMIFSDE